MMTFCADAVDRDVDPGALPNNLTAEFGDPDAELSFGSFRVLPRTVATYALTTADITWNWRAPVARAADAVDGGQYVPVLSTHRAAQFGDSGPECCLSCYGVLPPPPR